MVNEIILIGNLGKDIELRYSGNGNPIANFTVATSHHFKDKEGKTQKQTEWHRIVFFGKTAAFCGEHLHKGSKVYIKGRIQTREWEDKDGNKRYTTEVVGREIKFLDSKQTESGDSTTDDIPYDDE